MKKKLKHLLNLQLFASPDDAEIQQEEPNPADRYVQEVHKMRETMVPKEDYEKLKKENETLIAAVIEGEPLPDGQSGEEDEGPTASSLRSELYGADAHELTNLAYIQKTLQLRDIIMEEGGSDPFLPKIHGESPSSDDFDKANETARFLQSCVDDANGEPEVFNGLLQSRLTDSASLLSALRARKVVSAKKGK